VIYGIFKQKKPKFRETCHGKFFSGYAAAGRFHQQVKKAGNSNFKTNFEFPAFSIVQCCQKRTLRVKFRGILFLSFNFKKNRRITVSVVIG